DFRADAGTVEVLKVVHIDAVAADPVAETAWLQSLADAPDGGGFPQGIVAMVDLSRPNADAMLERQAGYRNVRGIRQILNVHPDPLYDYVSREYLDDARWHAGFRLLRKYGLSFDLQLYPAQMGRAASLARANPDT